MDNRKEGQEVPPNLRVGRKDKQPVCLSLLSGHGPPNLGPWTGPWDRRCRVPVLLSYRSTLNKSQVDEERRSCLPPVPVPVPVPFSLLTPSKTRR